MRIDSAQIAGLAGLEVPDGTTVGSEISITITCRVAGLYREEIDTSTDIRRSSLPGELRADLVIIEQIR